jgi:hypothetical protein
MVIPLPRQFLSQKTVTAINVTSGGTYIGGPDVGDKNNWPKVIIQPTGGAPGYIKVEKYNSVDFTLLGIPLTF